MKSVESRFLQVDFLLQSSKFQISTIFMCSVMSEYESQCSCSFKLLNTENKYKSIQLTNLNLH